MKTKAVSVRRIMAILVAFSIILGPVAAQPVFGASGKTKLVSSVTKYDYKKGKWVKNVKISFKYSKSYPKSITTYNYDTQESSKRTFKYTLRSNGDPEKMEMYNDSGNMEQTCSYEDGKVRTISYDCDGTAWKEVFQY